MSNHRETIRATVSLKGCAFLLLALCAFFPCAATSLAAPATGAADDFLDELSRRSCDFFLENAHPATGLVPDRGRADGSGTVRAASIAATGFGLAALCIADHRGWLKPGEAPARIERTLAFARDALPHEHGFFYRYMDIESGRRIWDCDASSIDTALFIAGALLCREYVDDPAVDAAVNDLYRRIDWTWMLNGGRTLAIGWSPEKGFFDDRWSVYSEHMLLYLLGLGAQGHPLPAETWAAWRRVPVITYGGRTFIQCPPLFTHQYSHAWIDFRGRRDAYADYWLNSRLATLAQREFCADLSDRFPRLGPLLWGLSAADGPKGYSVWGGPPPTLKYPLDGTVVPCAVAGSLPFAPEACIPTLLNMRDGYGVRIWKKYGFVDSFNPHTDWTAPDVIGIDLGITMVMRENLRDGFVWRHMMASEETRRGMERAGFREGAAADPTCSLVSPPCRRDLRHPEAPVAAAGRFGGWEHMAWQTLDRCHLDIEDDGAGNADAAARFAFAWDETNLYFSAEVEDRSPMRSAPTERMFEEDCVELFIDPRGDDLRWNSPADFQFGFSPRGSVQEWFGGRTNVALRARDTGSGYRIDAMLPWGGLGVEPRAGVVLGASPAVINRFATNAMLKLNWHWEVKVDSFALGKVRLE